MSETVAHVALPAQIVELGPAVHRTAIVPHDEIIHPPAMGVNELPLCRVRSPLVLGFYRDQISEHEKRARTREELGNAAIPIAKHG